MIGEYDNQGFIRLILLSCQKIIIHFASLRLSETKIFPEILTKD